MIGPHTEGPWMPEVSDDDLFRVVSLGTIVAELPFGAPEADVHLLAAAVSMLKALRDAEAFIESVDPSSFTLEDVRAAIADATGVEA